MISVQQCSALPVISSQQQQGKNKVYNVGRLIQLRASASSLRTHIYIRNSGRTAQTGPLSGLSGLSLRP